MKKSIRWIKGDSKELSIEILANKQIVDVDGRIDFELIKDDVVTIKKLKKTLKYIVFKSNNYLENIREKIKAL